MSGLTLKNNTARLDSCPFFEPQRTFVSQTNHGERGNSRMNRGGPQDGASVALVATWYKPGQPPRYPSQRYFPKISSRLRGYMRAVRADCLCPRVYGACGTGQSWALPRVRAPMRVRSDRAQSCHFGGLTATMPRFNRLTEVLVSRQSGYMRCLAMPLGPKPCVLRAWGRP
jgi:hypothetical protein